MNSALVVITVYLTASSVIADQQWDYFTFTQAWPPGTCAAAQYLHHTCQVPSKVSTWCIHGLWPSTYDRDDDPADCNPDLHFDFSKVAKLTNNLTTYWPNLYNDTPFDSFWEHEWDKHGTCCQDLPATTGELNYFTKVLELQQKYDLRDMLSKSGVTPTTTKKFYYTDFTEAVKAVTGYEPVVECSSMKLQNGTRYEVLDQIEVCLSKQFTPVHCADRLSQSDSLKFKGDDSIYSLTMDPEFVMYWRNGWHSSNCPKAGFFYPPITHG